MFKTFLISREQLPKGDMRSALPMSDGKIDVRALFDAPFTPDAYVSSIDFVLVEGVPYVELVIACMALREAGPTVFKACGKYDPAIKSKLLVDRELFAEQTVVEATLVKPPATRRGLIEEGRLRRVYLTNESVLALISPGGPIIAARLQHPKLPADARVLNVHGDYSRQAVALIVASAEFEPVPAGSKIPLLDENQLAEVRLFCLIDDAPNGNPRAIRFS